MKKILFILSSAALVFTACQKEENAANNGEGMFLTATVEQQVEGADTKSTLDGTTVEWSVGDVIRVYNADGTASTDLTATKKGTSSSFSGSDLSSGTPDAAIYPASIAGGYNGTDITFTLPAKQTYAADSFGPGANVAVGTVSSGSIAFKNVCGVFKLTIYGNYTVSEIKLSGKNSEKLNGSYSVAASTYTCNCATTTTDTEKTITLDCSSYGETTSGAKDGGVTLSPTTATTFYFVVPVGAFSKGFVAKVYEKDNTTSYTYTELSTTSANSIIRSRVKAMPESTIVPPAYQKVEYIQTVANSTTYINTTLVPTQDYKMQCVFQPTVQQSSIYVGCRNGSAANLAFAIGSGSQNTRMLVSFGNDNGNRKLCEMSESQRTSKWDITLDKDGATGTVDNNEYKYTFASSFSSQEFTCVYPVYIGGSGNKTLYSAAKFYIVKVWNNGTLVGNFIPAKKKSDNTIGMYNLIATDASFFPNSGTGTLGVGPDVTH